MDQTKIAREALRSAIQSNDAQTALHLICTLVEQGVVSLDTPTEGSRTLMASILRYALLMDRARPGMPSTVMSALLNINTMTRFLNISHGQAFAAQGEDGEPFVGEILKSLVALQQAKRTNDLGTGKKLDIDGAIALMLPSAIPNASSQARVAWMQQLFELDFPRAVDVLWPHVDMLTITKDGPKSEVLLMQAKHATAWERFIADGGKPGKKLRDKPLWSVLLDACTKAATRPEKTFLGGFEQWFVANAGKSVEMQARVQDLAFARGSKSSEKTSTQHWINIFKAAPNDWAAWRRADEVPLWMTVCAAKGVELIDEIAAHPSLAKALPEGMLETVRAYVLLDTLRSASNSAGAARAVDAVLSMVKTSGLPFGARPYVLDFANSNAEGASLRQFAAMAMSHHAQWWGDDAQQTDVERKVLLGLGKFGKAGLKRWNHWFALTQHPRPGPHLMLAHQIVHAMAGRWDNALAVDPATVGPALLDPLVLSTVKTLSASFPTARKPAYQTWLDSALLHAHAPAPTTVRKATMRL